MAPTTPPKKVPPGPYKFPAERVKPAKPAAPIPVARGSEHFVPKEAA